MSSKTQRTIAAAAGAASLFGVVGLTATSASAATHRPVVTTATTQLINRPDGGGGGNTWANDTFTRTLTLTYQGKTGPVGFPYAYTAQLSDKGTFLDLPGQFTPNQGGHDLGRTLKPVQVRGTMKGGAYFAEFFSSVKAHSPRSYINLGMETRENDHGRITGLNFHPSSTWPAQAFPASATFSAPLNEVQYDYVYTVPAWNTFRTVNGHKVTIHHRAQTWEDSSWNNDGQLRADGNITGRS